MSLRYVDVASGGELDVVTLERGQLQFATGAAKPLFASRMDRYGHTPMAAYELLTGWSNGYARLIDAETE